MSANVVYSIVIPVYNSAETLEELYKRLQSVLKDITEQYEVIFVDDASADASWQKLEVLHKADSRVKIIQLMRNFGQHNAIICGFHFIEGECVITLDDDLQNPPEEIPKLINKMKDGYDVVYGEYISKQHNFFRNFGSSLIQVVYMKVFGVKDKLTAFRIIRQSVVKAILRYEKNYVFIDGLLAWSTKNIGYVKVVHDKRVLGKSGYSVKKLFTLSLNMVTNFSVFPLQVASVLGLLFAIVGFIFGIFFLIKKIFFGIPVEGFTSIIIAITTFSGIQLLTLGLIGEYLGRVHLNINNKPQFLIREKQIE